MKALQPKLSVSAVALGDDGAVRFRLNAHLSDTKGQTLAVRPSEEGFQLDPALLDGLPLEPFDIADPRSSSGGAIQLHDAERQVWWYPETELAPHTAAATDGTFALVVAGEVMIDPTRAADGHPLPAGRYVVWFRGTFLGLGRRRRIPIRGSVQGMDGWTLTGDGLLATRLRRSSDDRLELEVKDGPALLGRKIRPATRSARACGNRAVPIRMGRCVASAPVPVRLELWKSTGPRTLVDAILNTTGDGAVIELPERVSLSREACAGRCWWRHAAGESQNPRRTSHHGISARRIKVEVRTSPDRASCFDVLDPAGCRGDRPLAPHSTLRAVRSRCRAGRAG